MNKYIPVATDGVLRRFNNYVNTAGDCWEWAGGKYRSGYGQFWIGRKSYRAHRVSWVIERGQIPDGMLILHHCDNPGCVNVEHLYLGTHLNNMQDMVKRNRCGKHYAVGERHGASKLTIGHVIAIKHIYALGETTMQALGKQYGVSASRVSDIVHGKTWVKALQNAQVLSERLRK